MSTAVNRVAAVVLAGVAAQSGYGAGEAADARLYVMRWRSMVGAYTPGVIFTEPGRPEPRHNEWVRSQ